MEKSPKISVVVPIYNVAQYLPECLHSIFIQSFRDFEIILVDDGSTDSSGQICDEWAERDSRICVIHQKNQGLSAARNLGIDMSTGEYIIFLDSDDYWKDKDVLRIIVERLILFESDVLCFNFEKTGDRICQRVYFPDEVSMPLEIETYDSFEYLSKHDLWIACAWNKVIRRELFKGGKLQFKEGIISEDIDWCMRLALLAESFDFVNCVVVCYRQREASISKCVTYKKVVMLLDSIKLCLDLFDAAYNTERAELLKPYIAYQYGTVLSNISMIGDRKQEKAIIKKSGTLSISLIMVAKS